MTVSLLGRTARIFTCTLALTFPGSLAGAQQRGDQTFFGLSHVTEGLAQLVGNADGSLAIHNIGSSGKDGVRVELGDAGGWTCRLDPAPTGDVTCETIVCKMQRLELGGRGLTHELGMRLDEQPDGRLTLASHVVNTNVHCLRLELFLNGDRVAVRDSDATAGQLAVGDFVTGPGGEPLDIACYRSVRISAFDHKVLMSIARPGAPFTVELFDGVPRAADHVRVTYMYDDDNASGVNPLYQEASITGSSGAAGGGILHLHAEGIVHRDIACRTFGDATFLGTCDASGRCSLAISNLGSSGKDGVSLSPPGPDSVDDQGVVAHAISSCVIRLDASQSLPPGGSTEFVIGNDPPALGPNSMRCERPGDQLQCVADFASTGAQSLRVETYNSGALASSVTVSQNVVTIRCSDAGEGEPLLCGSSSHFVTDTGDPVYGFGMCFDRPCNIAVPGAVPAIGDEVRCFVEGVSVAMPSPMCTFSAQGPSTLTINGTLELSDGGAVASGGLPHVAQGQAQLAASDVDGDGRPDLVVSNIGSSGKDGVSISVGESQGVACAFDDSLDWSQPGFRWWVNNKMKEAEVDEAEDEIDEHIINIDPTTAQMLFDYNAPPGTMLTVQGFGPGGQRIFSFEIPDGDSIFLTGDAASTKRVARFKAGADLSGTVNRLPGEPVSGINVSLEQIPGGTIDVSHPVHGQFTGVADILATIPSSPSRHLTSSTIRCDGVSSFAILETALIEHDNAHVAGGNATMRGEVCGSDASSSGAVVLQCPGGSCSLHIDALDDDSDDDGIPDIDEVAGMSFVLDGTHSQDDQQVQSFSWRQLSGPSVMLPDNEAASVSFDLDPGGQSRSVQVGPIRWMAPESLRVSVHDENGTELAAADGLGVGNVAAAFTPVLPGTYVFELTVSDARRRGAASSFDGTQHTFVWDSDVDLSIAGQAPITARELRIVGSPAAGATVDPVNLRACAFAMNTTAPYAIGVTEEGVQGPVPLCPAGELAQPVDLVDVFDLFVLLNNWGGPGPGADLAAPDDVVNVFDLFALLSAWGPCN